MVQAEVVRPKSTLFTVAVLLAPGAAAAQAGPAREMGTLVLKTGVDGATVHVDGAEIGQTPLPGPWMLPAGRHRVVVRPGDAAPASADVDVPAAGEAVVELLPRVEARAPAPVADEAAVRVVQTGPGFSMATAGYVTAGVGLAAAAAGTFFLIDAQTKADEASGLNRETNERADLERLVDDVDRADFYGKVFVGVGVGALLGGAAMVLLASDGPLSAAGGVMVGPAPGGAVVGGRF